MLQKSLHLGGNYAFICADNTRKKHVCRLADNNWNSPDVVSIFNALESKTRAYKKYDFN